MAWEICGERASGACEEESSFILAVVVKVLRCEWRPRRGGSLYKLMMHHQERSLAGQRKKGEACCTKGVELESSRVSLAGVSHEYHSLWSWEQDFSHGVFCLAFPPKGD